MEFKQVCDARMDEGLRYRKEKDIIPTLTSHLKSLKGDYTSMVEMRDKQGDTEKVRIRKLTSRECYRLMGFSNEDYDKAKEVVSDSQLYKQAGNSIVVDVLMAIFKEML